MGVFTIHSNDVTDITCGMFENTTSNYQVLVSELDMAYEKRVELIYAQSGQGGGVANANSGLVPVKLRMMIKGSTQAGAMSNLQVLTRTLTNMKGGYLEYRPIGLSAGVMSTWYKFLQSPIPKLVRAEGLIDKISERFYHDETVHAIMADVVLQTFAWGTSDPNAPIEIVASQVVDNCYDASNDNTFAVASSLVKGDAIIPIIKVTGDDVGGGIYGISTLYVHKKVYPIGGGDHLDWREAEDFESGWTDAVDAYASNGYYAHATGVSPDAFALHWSSDTTNEAMTGKVTPIMCAWKEDASDLWTCFLTSQHGGGAHYQVTDTIGNDKFAALWRRLIDFSSLDLPVTPKPDWVDAIGWPSFDDFMGGYCVFECSSEDASDRINIDFFWFPVIDGGNYLAKISTTKADSVLTDVSTASYLLIDSVAGITFLMNGVNDRVYDIWTVHGPSLTDMMIFKGYDAQFRLVGMGYNGANYHYRNDFQYNVTVNGIYATIYPFQEA